MNDKIDGVFEYKAYRYVPFNLKNEWKTLYNYTYNKFYDKLNTKNKLFAYKNFDILNEEIGKVNNLKILCENFKLKINNIKPQNKSDMKYSEEIKLSLLKSINEIEKFLNIKKNILIEYCNKKKIPLKENNNIEHSKKKKNLNSDNTDDINNIINDINNKNFLIIITLIFIILFYLSI